MFNRSGKKKFRLRFCPVLDKQKCIGLVDLFDIFDGIDLKNESIEIYGLGFVGLTLATILHQMEGKYLVLILIHH